MSIDISWCEVCENGSIEYDPPFTSCVQCGQSFHRHCSTDQDALEDFVAASQENEGEDTEYYDDSDCPPEFCPKCTGGWQDPAIKEFASGFLLSLYHTAIPNNEGLKTLRGEDLQRLLLWFRGNSEGQWDEGLKNVRIELDLTGFNFLDREATSLLQNHSGDVDLGSLVQIDTENFAEVLSVRGEISLRLSSFSQEEWELMANRGTYHTNLLADPTFTEKEAKHFAGKEVNFSMGIKSISKGALKHLADGTGQISLPEVAQIDLPAAKILSKSKRRINLHGLEYPGTEIAEVLRSNQENLGLPYWPCERPSSNEG
jgi:hypothetical protein